MSAQPVSDGGKLDLGGVVDGELLVLTRDAPAVFALVDEAINTVVLTVEGLAESMAFHSVAVVGG